MSIRWVTVPGILIGTIAVLLLSGCFTMPETGSVVSIPFVRFGGPNGGVSFERVTGQNSSGDEVVITVDVTSTINAGLSLFNPPGGDTVSIQQRDVRVGESSVVFRIPAAVLRRADDIVIKPFGDGDGGNAIQLSTDSWQWRFLFRGVESESRRSTGTARPWNAPPIEIILLDGSIVTVEMTRREVFDRFGTPDVIHRGGTQYEVSTRNADAGHIYWSVGLAFYIEGSRVEEVTIIARGPRTADGLHVGMTVDEAIEILGEPEPQAGTNYSFETVGIMLETNDGIVRQINIER